MGMWKIWCGYWCMSIWSTLHATCYDFGPNVCSYEIKLSIYEIIMTDEGSKGGYHLSFYQSKNRCHVSGQILSLTTSHLFLLHSQDCGFSGQWSGWRNYFWQSWLLTMTFQSQNNLFHMQVMIQMRSYKFFNCAFTSVDGCYLYIIIQNSMSQWDWGEGWHLSVEGHTKTL